MIKYIDLPVPHGFLIWRGKQTAIAMNRPIEADKLLVVSNGEAYGEAVLSKPIAVNTKEFDRRLESHCIKELERKLWWPDTDAFYIHDIKEFNRFDEPILFVDGEMVDYTPTEQEQALIDQAGELPKQLTIDNSAVIICGDGQHIISDTVKNFSDITRILEAGIKVNGGDEVLPIYSLALVRNPRLVVKKKEIVAEAQLEKQEVDDMPYAIAEEGFGDCEQIAVVKVDTEELVEGGCHETMEEAQAHLAALTLAEEESAMHVDEEEKQDDIIDGEPSPPALESGEEKAGARIKDAMKKRLREAFATLKDLLSWADYAGEDKSLSPYGIMVKEINGEPWHFMWSTNAFKDREQEIFSTKALDRFATEVNQKEEKGFFNFWHIPGTDFAKKEFVETVGRFLVEAGPYLKDEKGRAALNFFKQYKEGHPNFAPEGWGGSPEFRFNLEDRQDGVYDWLWIDRTSTLPRAAAANVFTQSGQQEVKMSTLEGTRKEAAIALFGQEFIENLLKEGDKRTATLEEAGVDHKENTPAESLDLEAVVQAVAEKMTVDLGPLTDVVTQLGEAIKAQSAEIETLKSAAKIKAEADTPRYVLSLTKRASEAVQTEVADDNDLKNRKPAETPADKTLAGAYFGR